MQYNTAGQPMEFYDMCAFCELDTGGNHQVWCPCYRLPRQLIEPDIRVTLTWQGMEDIRQGRFSYPDYIKKRRMEIGAHPEWGIKEIK